MAAAESIVQNTSWEVWCNPEGSLRECSQVKSAMFHCLIMVFILSTVQETVNDEREIVLNLVWKTVKSFFNSNLPSGKERETLISFSYFSLSCNFSPLFCSFLLPVSFLPLLTTLFNPWNVLLVLNNARIGILNTGFTFLNNYPQW